jgi:hypothetical protein
MTSEVASQAPPARRRGFRVSLRVFMLLVLVAGGWLGWKANKASRTRRAIAEIRRAGGIAYFDYQLDTTGNVSARFDIRTGKIVEDGQPPEPRWLQRILGPEYFHDVHAVTYGRGFLPAGAPERMIDFGALADLPEVHSLTLQLSGVGNSSLRRMPPLPRLRKFEIHEPRLGDEGVSWIASCRELEEVRIGNGQAGDSTARRLGTLTGLKTLHHMSSQLTDHGVEALAGLTSLTNLELFGPNLGDRSLRAVGELRNLEILVLSRVTQATNAGFLPLGNLSRLRNLTLRGASLSHWDASSFTSLNSPWALYLAETSLNSTLFSGIPDPAFFQHLSLADATIGDDAVESMAKVRSLKAISIIESDVSNAALKRLGQARPDIKVTRMGRGRRVPKNAPAARSQ